MRHGKRNPKEKTTHFFGWPYFARIHKLWTTAGGNAGCRWLPVIYFRQGGNNPIKLNSSIRYVALGFCPFKWTAPVRMAERQPEAPKRKAISHSFLDLWLLFGRIFKLYCVGHVACGCDLFGVAVKEHRQETTYFGDPISTYTHVISKQPGGGSIGWGWVPEDFIERVDVDASGGCLRPDRRVYLKAGPPKWWFSFLVSISKRSTKKGCPQKMMDPRGVCSGCQMAPKNPQQQQGPGTLFGARFHARNWQQLELIETPKLSAGNMLILVPDEGGCPCCNCVMWIDCLSHFKLSCGCGSKPRYPFLGNLSFCLVHFERESQGYGVPGF